ncbi:MAG: LamG-like jellyroll fold domain-containing protein, partial [Planctomycetaceae bacterium]
MDPSDWVSGRQFTGLEFDGRNDYLETSTNIGAALGGTASLSFWIQTNQTGGVAPNLSPGVTGVEVVNSVDDICWGCLDDQGRVLLSVGDTLAARSANPINDGRWHHVVITRDATSGVSQIFVDGQLSEERTGPTGTVSTPFRSLGRIEDQGGSPHYFDGRLDQIYVFDRVISAQDVTTLQENHAPKAYGTTSTVPNDRPVTIDDVRLGLTYDVESDHLSIHRLGQPTNGSVTFVGGSFVYEADSGYLGTDHFDVIVTDDNGGYSTTTMNLIVTDNSRTRSTGAFKDFQPVQVNGSNLTLSGRTVPRAFDWDGDGDSDLLVSGGGSIWLYENTGTPANPVFAAGEKIQVNDADFVFGSPNTAFTLADLTGDGVMDLIVNETGSAVKLYTNTSAADQVPVFGSSESLKTSDGENLQLGDWRFEI